MPIRCVLLSITFLILEIVFAASARADSESEYRQSIQEIGSKIKQLTRNLNANKALLKTEQDKLFETEQQLSSIQSNLNKIADQINQQQNKIEALNTELAQARTEQGTNRELLAKLVESRYKQGKQDYLKRFLNQENPYAVGRLNSYHDYFSKAYLSRFAELQAQIDNSARLQEDHQKAIFDLVQQRDRQNELQAQWQSTQQEREKKVARLNQRVGSSEEKIAELKKDRSRLNSLLQEIARQAAQMKRLDEERARQQTQQNNPTRTIHRPPVRGGFLKQKGRLSFPVAGTLKNKFGSRLPSSGMTSEGMFFNTKGSQPVYSIFRGRVLFADFLKGYGLLMIIDHGDDHISLYGHNELLYKRVGDTVDTNEVIAKSGVTGGLKTPGLYFEIRQNAMPVDPTYWCR